MDHGTETREHDDRTLGGRSSSLRRGKTEVELGDEEETVEVTNEGRKCAGSKWSQTDPDSLNYWEKRKLFSKMMKIAVLNVFRNHMYQFGGVTYRQLKGAPIGLRLTSVVARIVMDQCTLQ